MERWRTEVRLEEERICHKGKMSEWKGLNGWSVNTVKKEKISEVKDTRRKNWRKDGDWVERCQKLKDNYIHYRWLKCHIIIISYPLWIWSCDPRYDNPSDGVNIGCYSLFIYPRVLRQARTGNCVMPSLLLSCNFWNRIHFHTMHCNIRHCNYMLRTFRIYRITLWYISIFLILSLSLEHMTYL